MTDEPASVPPVDLIPLAHDGTGGAPFIYFDGVPNFGINAGIANMTLEALVHQSVNGKIITKRATVAHLRMGVHALAALKHALNGIELLANPAPPARPN